jgi:hypothetical protein
MAMLLKKSKEVNSMWGQAAITNPAFFMVCNIPIINFDWSANLTNLRPCQMSRSQSVLQ